MGWYGRDKAVKYFTIGFTEKELQELEDAYKKAEVGRLHLVDIRYFAKRTSLIRHLALTYLDLEKEYMQLKSEIKSIEKQAQSQTTAMGDTWTGYYRGVNRKGNIIFPKWG